MAAKQNASPKTQRAARTPKKGAVRQHAKKPANVTRLKSGEDILSVARGERLSARAVANRQRSTPNPIVTHDSFMERFGSCVTKVANDRNWSPVTRQLVLQYIRSLVKGDGSVPESLRGTPLEAVQQRFAMTCYSLRITNMMFLPGQSQGWFPKRYEAAIAFSLAQRAARKTVA